LKCFEEHLPGAANAGINLAGLVAHDGKLTFDRQSV
jgi:hypothetical protein